MMADSGTKRRFAERRAGMVRYTPKHDLNAAVKRSEEASDDDENDFKEAEKPQTLEVPSSSSSSKTSTATTDAGSSHKRTNATTAGLSANLSSQSSSSSTSHSGSSEHSNNGTAQSASHKETVSHKTNGVSSSSVATPSTPSTPFSISSAGFQTPSMEQQRQITTQTSSGAAAKIDRLLQNQSDVYQQIRDIQRTVDSLDRISQDTNSRLTKMEGSMPDSFDQLNKASRAIETLPKNLQSLLDHTRDQANLIANLTSLVQLQERAIDDLRHHLDSSLTEVRSEIKSSTSHHLDLELQLFNREQSYFASINRMIVGQAVLWLFVLVVFIGWLQATPYR